MRKDLGQLLNQARRMKERLEKLQEELGQKTVEAQSGGGMVICVVNGRQELLSLKISEEIFEEKDRELLEDLIVACVNEGMKRAREMVQEEMSKVTGLAGIHLPF